MNFQDKVNIDCCTCKNNECLIKYCDNQSLIIVSDKKNQIFFRKGQHVFLEGSPVYGVYLIQEGKVKVTSSSFLGKNQIVRLASDGHILGHIGSIGETYPVNAITIDDSCICFIENQILYDTLMANPVFTFQAMMFYSKELRKSEQRTKYFAQMTVEEKVIFALLYIAETFGLHTQGQIFYICLSRQEIAEIVGTNADQVSRTVGSLCEKNMACTDSTRIILLDLAGMRNYISHYKVGLL